MATRRNGIKRAVTQTTRTVREDPETGMNTKAFTIANTHPTPREPSIDWTCATEGVDPEIFHPTDLEGLAHARGFCGRCPAAALCEGLGLDRGEWGVWGGLLLEGGRVRDAPRGPGREKQVPAA